MSFYTRNYRVLNWSQIERCKSIILNYYLNCTFTHTTNEVQVYLGEDIFAYTFTLDNHNVYSDFETFLSIYGKNGSSNQKDFSFYFYGKSKNERILVEEEEGFSDSIYFTEEELRTYSSFKFYKDKTNTYPKDVFFKYE